jgi:hypothetical protein
MKGWCLAFDPNSFTSSFLSSNSPSGSKYDLLLLPSETFPKKVALGKANLNLATIRADGFRFITTRLFIACYFKKINVYKKYNQNK